MRRFFISASMLFVLLLCTGYSGYCSNAYTKADGLNSAVSIEDIIPFSLTEYLLDRGIDAALLRPVLLKNGDRKLFLLQSASKDGLLALLATPEGKGILLIPDRASSFDKQGSIITFDTAEDVYYDVLLEGSQIPTECLQQISETIKSFLYLIYDCVVKLNSRICIGSILDLVTDILFIPINCQGASPPEE